MSERTLFAVSDLHVDHVENRTVVDELRPQSDGDWLIVCGDVADSPAEVEWALKILRERFERVIWTPGNHELLAGRDDPPQLRGEQRYLHLVELCARIGVTTPEDPFPIWDGAGGPAQIAPLFLLYDYSFGRNVGARTAVSESQWGRFVDREIMARFPEGLTVYTTAGQWRDRASNKIVREPSKVVQIVLPGHDDDMTRLSEIAETYKSRFKQQSVITIVRPACVSF